MEDTITKSLSFNGLSNLAIFWFIIYLSQIDPVEDTLDGCFEALEKCLCKHIFLRGRTQNILQGFFVSARTPGDTKCLNRQRGRKDRLITRWQA